MKYLFLCAICCAALFSGCSRKQNTTLASSDDASQSAGQPKVTQKEVAKCDLKDLLLALKRVHFPFDSTTLVDSARRSLEQAAVKLIAYPEVSLYVDGHTDERGTTEYNMSLGERRANIVVDFLRRWGVDSSRLNIVSFGEEHPLASGTDTRSHAINRRVDFRLMRGSIEIVLEQGDLVDDDGKPL
jgi:peptidoglycan-associated lipoprotein